MNADFHDTICHGDAGDQSNQPRVDKGVIYAMTCLNEFLTKMQDTPHGASNLLDQSLVLSRPIPPGARPTRTRSGRCCWRARRAAS